MFLLNEHTHRMTVQYHPQVGHLYVPNIRARIPHETGGYFVQTNSSGFRSELEFEKLKKDKPRILFFGDSFIAGDGCDNEARFAERTAAALGAEAYNYGLSGSGTDQQMLIFEEFARDVERDLVVVAVMVENIDRIQLAARPSIDRLTGKKVLVPKPYFELNGEGLVRRNHPVPIQREAYSDFEEKTMKPGFKRKLAEKSNYLIKQITGDNHSALRRLLVKWSNLIPQPDYLDPNSRGYKLMSALLERFTREASAGSRVLLVPIPTPHYLIDEVKPVYQDFFKKFHQPSRGIYLYDTTNDLLSLPWETRKSMCFKLDYHFSPEGHRIVSELLAKKITELQLMPSRRVEVPRYKREKTDRKDTYILGISCFYHNSAAALIKNGKIVAACAEERFTRIKNDKRFPHQAINYCLEEAGIHQEDLTAIGYYDRSDLTLERLLQSQVFSGEKGEEMWLRMIPSWTGYKLNIPSLIKSYLHYEGPVLQTLHHRGHAASAFYVSPFQESAILTVDGVGEWSTATIGKGNGNKIDLLKEMNFPHSLGLFYSAVTQFTGFKVNSGEYKMMGLAPYGKPVYVQTFLDNMIHVHDDGSVRLNLDYFDFMHRPSMTSKKWDELFDGPGLKPDSRLGRREFDIARSAQEITEMALLRMAAHAQKLTGSENLTLAGGVALNCVANGKILKQGAFKNIWIQPAAGDDGTALGVALDLYYNYYHKERLIDPESDQKGSYWGPSYSTGEVEAFLKTFGHPYHKMQPSELPARVAGLLQEGKVVGLMNGRQEFGPRALGGRSIMGDPRNKEMQTTLNLKIKYRESFRPFAPSVLEEKSGEYFDLKGISPYMLIVAPVKEERRIPFELKDTEDLLEIVRQTRSDLPAITHIDYSARVQTIKRSFNNRYYDIIKAFEAKTGCAVVVNTSFNIRGEPIVLTPADCYRCFMRTEMDVLVLEDIILYKNEQNAWEQPKGHIENQHTDVKAPVLSPSYSSRLQKIFRQQFLPLAQKTKMSGKLSIRNNWNDEKSAWEEPLVPSQLFEYSYGLDNSSADEKARQLVKSWERSSYHDEWARLLADLILAGQRGAPKGEMEAEVEESVYVMF